MLRLLFPREYHRRCSDEYNAAYKAHRVAVVRGDTRAQHATHARLKAACNKLLDAETRLQGSVWNLRRMAGTR